MVVTNIGLNVLMDRLVNGGTYTAPTKFQVGTGTTTPSATDISLDSAIPISNIEQIDDCEVADWNGTNMTNTLNNTIFKQGIYALNLIKGITSVNASVDKNVTTLDFTSKQLSIWVYIKDTLTLDKLATSTCLVVRYGSDASNYFEWAKDKSDLTIGWNLLNQLTSQNGTETGTVDLVNCDYASLSFVSNNATDVWAEGSIIMDDWKLISNDDLNGDLEVGFPSVDNTNKEISFRATLNSVQANGYPLSEIGIVNTDTSPTLWSRATFTEYSKSDTEELRVIIKDKFTAN